MAEMYEQITDHSDAAKDRQVWQYKGKTNFDNLIEIHAERMQKLENVLYDMLTKRAISTAEGIQLDRLGEYLEVDRDGLGDEPYRTQLFSAASKLRKAGQVEVMLSTLRSLTGKPVSLLQAFPATMLMHVFVDTLGELTDEDLISETMQTVRSGGVKLDIGVQLNSTAFVFQSDSILGGSENSGFATLIDGTDGGNFPQLLG